MMTFFTIFVHRVEPGDYLNTFTFSVDKLAENLTKKQAQSCL